MLLVEGTRGPGSRLGREEDSGSRLGRKQLRGCLSCERGDLRTLLDTEYSDQEVWWIGGVVE